MFLSLPPQWWDDRRMLATVASPLVAGDPDSGSHDLSRSCSLIEPYPQPYGSLFDQEMFNT